LLSESSKVEPWTPSDVEFKEYTNLFCNACADITSFKVVCPPHSGNHHPHVVIIEAD
jgi:hypothetical protein